MLARSEKITYKEFLEVEKISENNMEYIDGQIYLLASPSVEHQRIVTRLSTEFGIYFRGKNCENFVSPFDVVFKNENEIQKLQPDLVVICEKEGLNKNNYTGVPALIVEVLSPSTSSKDYIQKMDVYMRHGVKEYWIVSPKNKEVQIFVLENGAYSEPISYHDKTVLESILFKDLQINLEYIFY